MADPIRIRVSWRNPERQGGPDPRYAFWAPFRAASVERSNDSVERFEGRLKAGLGGALSDGLTRHLARSFDQVATTLFERDTSPFRDLRFWFRGPELERGTSAFAYLDAFSRISEMQQQVLRESPELAMTRERLAAAGGVLFAVRIVGYGSLSLDVLPNSVAKLAKVFDSDFESFQVFLEVFLPVAFGEVFDQDLASELQFEIQAPTSLRSAFVTRAPDPQPIARPSGSQVITGDTSPRAEAREKAEFLWKVANGSLLFPVLLALGVMWYGVRELGRVREMQLEGLRPILQHQLELLREDRLRMQPGVRVDPTPVKP